MGKSVTATMMGVLIKQGAYELTQPAPIPEWQSPGDPRAKIRIADLLNMSSGLRIKGPDDPDFDPSGTYPDHLYLYTGRVNSFQYAATRPQQWPPGTVGRYRNTDPVLTNYLIAWRSRKRGEDYHSFRSARCSTRIGIRTMVIETDPFGNFLGQGYDFMSGRDWARLGNLYLQDGVWNGERILQRATPSSSARWRRAGAPDKRPIYGGFFWINGDGAFPVPREATTWRARAVRPRSSFRPTTSSSVRLGHFKGSTVGLVGIQEGTRAPDGGGAGSGNDANERTVCDARMVARSPSRRPVGRLLQQQLAERARSGHDLLRHQPRSVTGNIGGLRGADAICPEPGDPRGAGNRTFPPISARSATPTMAAVPPMRASRIGSGPWYQREAVLLANNLTTLHALKGTRRCSSTRRESRSTANGVGSPTPVQHDI
jgi:hypothetical protein